jgi:CBS domain-containing protein
MRSISQILDDKGRDITILAPDRTVREALRVMAYQCIGAIVVVDEKGLVGVMTERDYARKVALLDRTSATTPIGDIMGPAECIDVHRSLQEAMQQMTHARTRHLVVFNDDHMEGLVSIGDLVNALIQDQAQEIEHLSAYLFSGR